MSSPHNDVPHEGDHPSPGDPSSHRTPKPHDDARLYDDSDTANADREFDRLEGRHNSSNAPGSPPQQRYGAGSNPLDKTFEQSDDLYSSTPQEERHNEGLQQAGPSSVLNPAHLDATFEEDMRRALEQSVQESAEDHEQRARRLQERQEEHESQLNEVLQQSLAYYEAQGQYHQVDDEEHASQIKEALEQSLLDQDQREKRRQEEQEGYALQLREAMEASLEGDLRCRICAKPLEDPLTLPCQHTFCSTCVEWWSEWSDACPTCGNRCLGQGRERAGSSRQPF